MSEVNVPESENPETIKEPIEDPIEEAEENIDILAAADKRDEEIKSIVSRYRAKNPNAVLYLIEMPGDDGIYIGRLGSFEKMTQFAELMDPDAMKKNKMKTSTLVISFIQRYLVHPKLSDDDLAHKMKPGTVMAIMKAIQKANGFEDEAELKNL